MKKLILLSWLFIFFAGFTVVAQEEGYKFTDTKTLKATSVKDQYRSGTCWSFSALGFYEAELLRMGKGEYDLSEAFVIRYSYIDKAERYVRFHGALNFGGGGAFHDVTNVMEKYGSVPESAYPGLNYGTDKFDHSELDAVLKGYMDAIAKNEEAVPTTAWKNGFIAILDAYLGPEPTEFEYDGKKYTPKTFQESLGLNLDDYIEVTSFSHHPFYKEFVLEVPDNWSMDLTWNVTINDLTDIIDYSISKGYTVGWASDVSEKGFSWTNGVAVVPDANRADLTGTDREKWDKMSSKDKSAQLYSFEKPIKEITATQELRQAEFDNFKTTDDHGILIIGTATDQNGTEYYKVKNSWNTTGKYEGYFYASKTFVMMKTTDMLVNKKGVPPAILKKLGL